MQRSAFSPAWLRFAPLALLPGCLVAFNDYPLGERAAAGSPSAGGSSEAGSNLGLGGKLDAMSMAGRSGGSVGSGASAGSASGGTSPGDGGTNGEQVGGGPDQIAEGGAPSEEVNPFLLDDFEDGDELIFAHQGRSGAWYVDNDGTGVQMPEAGSPALPSAFMLMRSGSTLGMHTSGGPFAMWGAIVGTTLASDGGEPVPYDLSGFQGIKLWVRSNSVSPMAARQVRLSLVTPATSQQGQPGPCGGCGGHWGMTLPLTGKWVQLDVPFSELTQEGFGGPRPTTLDLTNVTALELQFPARVSFDVWLDDIELY